MKFCSAAGHGEELDKRFASLTVSEGDSVASQQRISTAMPPSIRATARTGLSSSKYAAISDLDGGDRLIQSPATQALKVDATAEDTSTELQRILSALRKLRESITATHRHDSFSQRCYIFMIRACILTKSWESYHPALLYLLGNIHKHTPLGQSELREFVTYRILDEACRIGDLAEAHRQSLAWNRYAHVQLVDAKVVSLLKSLVYDNWHQFWRIRRAVDGYQRSLMSWAEEPMRLHALKCVGRAYFTVDKMFIEQCTGSDWTSLLEMGVAWELQHDGKSVTVRKPKSR